LKVHSGVTLRAITEGPKSHFFGYFDKSPWLQRPEWDWVLAHETELPDRPPGPKDVVGLGYVDVAQGSQFHRLGETAAWNFQQGAMLQWVPRQGKTVLFNERVGDRAIAIVLEVESGRKRSLQAPVAALAPDGRFGLSVNFGRLNQTSPGYGYAGVRDPFTGIACPKEDGIGRVDLESGQAELLLSTHAVASFGGNGDAPGAYHWLNHVQFNTDGSRICFLHRCRTAAGTTFTRLIACAPDGTGMKVLISGMASHYDWRSPNEVLAWAGERKLLQGPVKDGGGLPIGKLLRKAYRILGKPRFLKHRLLNDRYVVINEQTSQRTTLAHKRLESDGHCSFSPDRQWLLTDTYPDRRRQVSLLLYHWQSGMVLDVAQFSSPPEFEDEVRCDLHPRWSPGGTRICVDSAHSGTRQIYVLDVRELVAIPL
jgi:hypothetical protein